MTAMSAGWPADYAYYPPVPRRAGAGLGRRRDTVPRIGWEWSLLGLNPTSARRHAAPASRPTVLVAMGGSDPHGLTLRMAKALAALDPGLPHPLCHRHRHEGCRQAWRAAWWR